MYYIIYPAASPSIGRRDFLGFSTNVVYSFLLLWQRLIKGSVACVRLNELGKQVKTTEIKVFAGKLGRETDIWWILINSGRHGNWRISGLAIYLKMFVIMPAITMPSFMLVSKSAQFSWNFELCRRITLGTLQTRSILFVSCSKCFHVFKNWNQTHFSWSTLWPIEHGNEIMKCLCLKCFQFQRSKMSIQEDHQYILMIHAKGS